MKIFYICDNEGPAYFPLDDLIDNFNASEADVRLDHLRQEVESIGWFAGIHENGRYLVLDPARFNLTLTPEGWDALLPNGSFK